MSGKSKSHDIFISYRRESGSELAQLIHDALSNRRYRVFMDVHSMDAGRFDEQLKGKIEEAKDVVVLLTLGRS